ncbi:Uu.00g070400.m01.CDS01 [Anthostomella pinea]|uniref:Uu.00g070400.m01.CDS01 n=1 Tax=Anthostomella pinea TaxID=933095 RepID=A0AAI8VVI7_9PEZI|nr:Uu.00g070400.m01.CDS01 [Anthostomella pinea]
MSLTFTTLDVFTSTRFRGNPLAIVQVPTGTDLSQEQKQLIAREFNFSETVFLHEQTDADVKARNARIDIFTPYAEVPFAGHPTIGTSTYLAQHLKLDSAKTLITKAGPLPFKALGDGAQLAVAHDVHIHNRPFADTEFGHYPVVGIVKGMTFILANQPDLEALAKPTENLLGSIAGVYTSHGALDEGFRVGIVVSYFFVDLGTDADGTRKLRTRSLGSREDPATGSAASALCSFLSLTERDGPLVRRYAITQGVEMGRQSEISVQVTVNGARTGVEEVLLSGTAVKVMEGKVDIPQV